MEGMIILSISCSHDVVVEHIYSLPGSNNSNWVCSNNSNWVRQGRGFGGSGGCTPDPPKVSQKEDIITLSISCSHDVAVEHIYSLSGSNNSNWVRQGRGFVGSEGGGEYLRPPQGVSNGRYDHSDYFLFS